MQAPYLCPDPHCTVLASKVLLQLTNGSLYLSRNEQNNLAHYFVPVDSGINRQANQGLFTIDLIRLLLDNIPDVAKFPAILIDQAQFFVTSFPTATAKAVLRQLPCPRQ